MTDRPAGDELRRVLLVADAASIHTARWANALAGRGIAVTLATVRRPGDQVYVEGVDVQLLGDGAGAGGLAQFVRAVPALRQLIARVRPDVVNSHYASDHALLANLAVAGSRPHLLSVWGRDVYEIPTVGLAPRLLVGANLQAATAIASTSRAMASQTRQWCRGKKIFITPFGIDLAHFTPRSHAAVEGDAPATDATVRVGTVKSMLFKYGIDTLLEAFAELAHGRPGVSLEVYGGGADLPAFRAQAEGLGIAERVTFHGAIDHQQVPAALQGLDVYVALSRKESFGVAILEASACAVPVVVSDAPGPLEVTPDGVTGYVVPMDDPHAAAARIGELVDDAELRRRMGEAGRAHVEAEYSWEHSVDDMLEAYRGTIALHRGAPVRRGAAAGLAVLRRVAGH